MKQDKFVAMCKKGNYELVKKVIISNNKPNKGFLGIFKNKIDINKPDKDGNIALHQAVVRNHIDIVKLLVKNGADIDKPEGSENTPLFYAASLGYDKIVEILIKNGADVNKTVGGKTPAYWAQKRRIKIVR